MAWSHGPALSSSAGTHLLFILRRQNGGIKGQGSQKAVGGYVEVFDLEHGVSMWGNEEAKVNSTLLGGTETRTELENVKATHLITHHGPGLFPNDYIGGDVAFTGQPDDNGNTTGLSAEGIEMIHLA